jgi:D-sedoheptulose 7-phosphate isomerase
MNFKSYIKYVDDTLNSIDKTEVENLVLLLYDAFLNSKTVFFIGNGGSAANASHFAEDLSKGTCLSLEQEKRVKALSLTDNSPWITAISNDNGYDKIFEQQLKTYAISGDLLIAISGSGNSPNIIRAVEWANRNNIVTLGITGFDGGKLRQINKFSLHVPLNDMCTTESIHAVVFHYVVIELQKKINSYFEQLKIK